MRSNTRHTTKLYACALALCLVSTNLIGCLAVAQSALEPYTGVLPNISDIYMAAEKGSKGAVAIEAYKRIQNPFFVIAANNSMAVATIIFSQGANADAIMQLASERLARYGALTLYGFGSGASAELLNGDLEQTAFNLYLKPITLGTLGIIGMTIVSSAIPVPLVAASAHSVFQGMTMTSGIKLATNMLNQGVNAEPVKEAIRTLRQPETALFNNAIVIAGTLGVMAVTPLLITYAGAIASTALATQITATMALSAALDITAELSNAAIYSYSAATGSAVSTDVVRPLPERIQNSWQSMTNFFSSFMGEAGSFINSLYGGPSENIIDIYGGNGD